MDDCKNCGRTIGDLEQSFSWNGHAVCATCSQSLQDTVIVQSPQIQLADPLDALAQVVPQYVRPTYVQNVYRAAPNRRVQLIERTSKFWKAQMVLAAILFIFGFVVISGVVVQVSPDYQNATAPPYSSMIVVGQLAFWGGLAWLIAAKVGAWWHHG